MRNQYILLRILVFVLCISAANIWSVNAAESRGDTIYNEADNRFQILIQEIDRESQYYSYIPAIDHYLDGLADEGIAKKKKINEQWLTAQNTLKEQLEQVYAEEFAARSEYEERVNECLKENPVNYEGIEEAKAAYDRIFKTCELKAENHRKDYDGKLIALANDLNQTYSELQGKMNQSAADVEAAEDLYHKQSEALEILDQATAEQRQSASGKNLAAAISNVNNALNGTYAETGAFVRLLESLLQYIEVFEKETTSIHVLQENISKGDVYTVNGILLLQNVTEADAAEMLPRGIYIINGRKTLLP